MFLERFEHSFHDFEPCEQKYRKKEQFLHILGNKGAHIKISFQHPGSAANLPTNGGEKLKAPN